MTPIARAILSAMEYGKPVQSKTIAGRLPEHYSTASVGSAMPSLESRGLVVRHAHGKSVRWERVGDPEPRKDMPKDRHSVRRLPHLGRTLSAPITLGGGFAFHD